MDTKQVADTLAMLQADINNMSDLHGQDFMYFSHWLRELDDKVKGFDARILKMEKISQFNDMLKPAAQTAIESGVTVSWKRGWSKPKTVLIVGLAAYGVYKINESRQPKKEQ